MIACLGVVTENGVTSAEPPPVLKLSASEPISAIECSLLESSGRAARFSSSVIADPSIRWAVCACACLSICESSLR